MKTTLVALIHNVKLNESAWREKFVMRLLETAYMLKADHKFCSMKEMKEFMTEQQITFLEILDAEIQSAHESLVKGKKVIKAYSDGGYRMVESAVQALQADINSWMALEEAVKADWIQRLCNKHAVLDIDGSHVLWRVLTETFVPRIMLKRGATTAQLIYRTEAIRESADSEMAILDESVKSLPPQLQPIARIEFPSFFVSTSRQTKDYLIGLLSCVFDQFSVAIPKECLAEIHSKAAFELTLLLDTNFIFSLLDLHEHHLNEAVRELRSILRRISGFEGGRITMNLRYVKDTEDELIRTIDAQVANLRGIVPSRAVAEAAVRSRQIGGVALAYFRKLTASDIPISIDEFLSPYRRGIRQILKGLGVEIYVNPELDGIRNSQDVVDDISSQAQFFKRAKKDRLWASIEHDVRLWHYVRYLRRNVPCDALFFQKKSYIMTCDYSFLAFDRYKHGTESDDLYCLLPPQLMQTLCFLVPRTEDYENAFIHSLRVPLAGHLHGSETERVSLDIVKAISVYEDLPEDVALQIIEDESLREQVKNIRDPDDIRRIVESNLAIELDLERKKHEHDVEKMTEHIRVLESQYKQVEDALSKKEKEVVALELACASSRDSDASDTKAPGMQAITHASRSWGYLLVDALGVLAISSLVYLSLKAYVAWRWLSDYVKIGISVSFFLFVFYRRNKDQLSPAGRTIGKFVRNLSAALSVIKTIASLFK